MDGCAGALGLLLVWGASAAFPAEAPGLTMVTHGRPVATAPSDTMGNQLTRYGLGFPLQVGPTTGALLCNRRTIGEGRADYEDGTDAFVFDGLWSVAAAGAVPLARNEEERDGETGQARVIIKFPLSGYWIAAAGA